MNRIISIGECMVELAPHAEPDTYRMGIAGDTLNTAWYLRMLMPDDWHIDYFTAIGEDGASKRAVDFLKKSNLGTDHIIYRSDSTIGLYLIELNNGERTFSYWRGQSAARTLANDKAPLEAALKDATIAYLSGITIAILEKNDRDRLLEVLSTYRANGGQVVFDSNLRPKLWNSTDEMKEAVMQFASISDIVLPSFDDEADWFGDKDLQTTAKRYGDCGVKTVIVKNGSQTMLGVSGTESILITPEKITNIVDTTAAGDSFNAGFLNAFLQGNDLETSMRAAALLAGSVVQKSGALVELD